MQALDKARELSRDRGMRAKELKAGGGRVIGYICIYPPVELITAAGLVPFRITGSLDPVTGADSFLEPMTCPFVRSCLDLAVKKEFDFTGGVIWPHSCDNVQKVFDIWKHYAPSEFFHYLDVPHMTGPSSFEFFFEELINLKESLEEYTGEHVTEEKINEAIKAHNENRALLRELSGLRKQDPPLLRGSEMMEIMLAATALPVGECNDLLRAVIGEVQSRDDGPGKKSARLLLYGSEVDDVSLLRLLEDSGANVVIEDICMGSKHWLHDVATDGDPLANIAKRYLEKITCPRTFRFTAGGHDDDLEARFGYILDMAREYNVNGAVLYVLMFCDTFEFDAPDVRDYLKEKGVPSLHLEDDYSLSGIDGFKTRIKAFLEMIS
jgi:bzd-type benzoyl-CoA reductase N subunit